MSQNQINAAIYSINPVTSLPYPSQYMQVADGQGNRVWQDVFVTISTQAGPGAGSIGYLPSSFLRVYGAASSLSTVVATSYSTLSTMIGEGGIPGSITTYQLQSTVSWVQDTAQYVSSGQLVSTMTPFFNGSLSFMSNIQSTVNGLGSARYISSASFQSTSVGGYRNDLSTMVGLGTFGYVSSLSLQSTVQHLGQASYISSLALTSTVTGLLYPGTSPGGSLGVVVTGSSDPPFQNFATLTGQYLTNARYLSQSNAPSFGVVIGTDLPSTTLGLISSLGSYRYVSTATLLSTSAGIQAAKQNIFIDRAGNMNITNSQVYISSVGAITFLSSFVESSILYKGGNGLTGGTVSNNSNISFSTVNLQFDAFSSFIVASSKITVEVFPTFQFDTLTTGSIASRVYQMSTCIQYGTTTLPLLQHTTLVAGTTAQSGYSNFFQQPIKFTIPGASIVANYAHPYVLYHTVLGGLSYQTNVGFFSQDVNTFFASTNSYFLTVQNLSF